jgi:hypothetical protein
MKLRYRLIKTRQRLTFDVIEQDMSFCGTNDDEYVTFEASNGVQIISRSRMDIQTDRLWLIGCKPNERSGTMVFSSDEKRDREFDRFQEAIMEWARASHFKHNAINIERYEFPDETFEVVGTTN